MLAAHDHLYGEAPGQNGTENRIVLVPPGTITNADWTALLEKLTPVEFGYFLNYWDYLGEETLLHLALRMDGAIGVDGAQHDAKPGAAFALWLETLAERNPKRAAADGPGLLTKYGDGTPDAGLPATIAAACAHQSDAAALAWANAWVDRQRSLRAELDPPRDVAASLFAAAGVAAALKRPDAASFLDLALSAAALEGKDATARYVPQWGKYLAAGGLTALHGADDDLPAPDRFRLWCAALPVLAAQDPGAADSAMDVIAKLQVTPEIVAWNIGRDLDWDNAQNDVDRAGTAWMAGKAASGSAEVLEVAPKHPAWMSPAVYGELASAGSQIQDLETARAALRAGVLSRRGPVDPSPYFASLA